MRNWLATSSLAIAVAAGAASPALAQRTTFERSFDVNEAAILDVSTIRGKIDVITGEPGRIVVTGTVTVRAWSDLRVDAAALAREVTEHPPVERDGDTIRLRPPSGSDASHAVTLSYEVRVPPTTEVVAVSDSGAMTMRGLSGTVTVRTQSSAIDLSQLAGTTGVTTGSGAVTVEDIGGALTVKTGSSAFTGRALKNRVQVRTQSGAVTASLTGDGDVDVETGSSEIRLKGVRGGMTVVTQSGRVSVEGSPGREWHTSTGSGRVSMLIDSRPGISLDAVTGSGSITLEGASIQGSMSKRTVTGAIGGGGPLVRVRSRSGSIGLNVTPR